MKKIKQIAVLVIISLFFQNCSSTKVQDAWKAEPSVVEIFKQKNVLVIARTSDNPARLAFEQEIVKALGERGIKATGSYSKAPKIHPNREMSDERLNFIKSLMKSEGFDAVVLTVIKDKQVTKRVTTNGIYFGASYGNYYPSYYGGFYNYFSYPYAYGSYYDSFGGYIPTSTSTSYSTKYVLETVAYNLDEIEENQLVAVVTISLDNPKDAYKTAGKYVELMMENLETPKK
ncbi:hypothetical protein [Winogradskyella sp. UBA3174]|jgi:hypothetical protein|uniref:hypothetical protein n=1 Tax=Winogradskyella sp. UBA3174 TaxID=1947785 RepID=UPI0025CEA691|nr:hypothetical protein [Winogradskyella sp. UBA3174]|tara:strand:+ start:23075 stop:23767 length:693 start_codon:yes stop_codon:yes gene_type:complete